MSVLDTNGLNKLITQLVSHDLSHIKVACDGTYYDCGYNVRPRIRINPEDDMFLVLAIPSEYDLYVDPWNGTGLDKNMHVAMFMKINDDYGETQWVRSMKSSSKIKMSFNTEHYDLFSGLMFDYTNMSTGEVHGWNAIEGTLSKPFNRCTSLLNRGYIWDLKSGDWVYIDLPNYFLIYLPVKEYTECLREDTLIPLEDGTYKTIAEIVKGDKVAFYNTNNKDPELRYNMVCVPATYTKQSRYKRFIFENGSELNIAGNHMLYNVDEDRIIGSYEWQPGMQALDIDNKPTKLLSIEDVVDEEGHTFYNIYCRHYKYFANNILCGHSQAALYDEFKKPTNVQHRFKNTTYMNHLKRKSMEKMIDRGFVPSEIQKPIDNIEQEYTQIANSIQKDQKFLDDTDYKIVRQITKPVLSEAEYEQLEADRENARGRIHNNRLILETKSEKINTVVKDYLDTISTVTNVM